MSSLGVCLKVCIIVLIMVGVVSRLLVVMYCLFCIV